VAQSKKNTPVKRNDAQGSSDIYEMYKKREEEVQALRAKEKEWDNEKKAQSNEIVKLQRDLQNTKDEIEKLKKEHEELIGDRIHHTNQEKIDSPAESGQSETIIQRVSQLPEKSTVFEPAQTIHTENRASEPSIDHSSLLSTISLITQAAKQLYQQLEPIRVDLEKVQSLEEELQRQKKRNHEHERDKIKLKNELSRFEQQLKGNQKILYETRQELDQTRQEKEEVQKSIEVGNHVIESLNEQLAKLQEQMSQAKHLVGIEWVKELAFVLPKLSSLAGLEPESVKGLKPRAIYEMFLDWMEKVFGERPKPFPNKKQLLGGDAKNPKISLDADQDDLGALLKFYDWSPDHPFEDLMEGSRRRKFRILHWGWKVNEIVLVQATISPLPIENTSEVKKE